MRKPKSVKMTTAIRRKKSFLNRINSRLDDVTPMNKIAKTIRDVARMEKLAMRPDWEKEAVV